MSTQSAVCLWLVLALCLAGSQTICDEQKGSEAATHSSLEAQHEDRQPQVVVARSTSEARATVAGKQEQQQERQTQQHESGSSGQQKSPRSAADKQMRGTKLIGKSDGRETKEALTAAEEAKQSASASNSNQQLDVNQEPRPVPTLIEHNQVKQEVRDEKLLAELSPKEKSAVASPKAKHSPAYLSEEVVGALEKRLASSILTAIKNLKEEELKKLHPSERSCKPCSECELAVKSAAAASLTATMAASTATMAAAIVTGRTHERTKAPTYKTTQTATSVAQKSSVPPKALQEAPAAGKPGANSSEEPKTTKQQAEVVKDPARTTKLPQVKATDSTAKPDGEQTAAGGLHEKLLKFHRGDSTLSAAESRWAHTGNESKYQETTKASEEKTHELSSGKAAASSGAVEKSPSGDDMLQQEQQVAKAELDIALLERLIAYFKNNGFGQQATSASERRSTVIDEINNYNKKKAMKRKGGQEQQAKPNLELSGSSRPDDFTS